jgi:hypothetical protein
VRLEQVDLHDEAWPEEYRGAAVYVVVDGRTRILHARRAAEDMVKDGTIRELDDWQVDCLLDPPRSVADTLAVVTVSNRFRRKESAIELGIQYAQRKASGVTAEAAAEGMRVKESQLRNFEALAVQGVSELHRAYRDGRVKATEACKIARLDPAQQRAVLGKLPGEGKVATGQAVTDSIADAKGEPTPIKPPSRTALRRAVERVATSDESQEWTPREQELLAVLAGAKSLDKASPELRALFA